MNHHTDTIQGVILAHLIPGASTDDLICKLQIAAAREYGMKAPLTDIGIRCKAAEARVDELQGIISTIAVSVAAAGNLSSRAQ